MKKLADPDQLDGLELVIAWGKRMLLDTIYQARPGGREAAKALPAMRSLSTSTSRSDRSSPKRVGMLCRR
jgi:hypothetical protein